jgi:hypothetical protein
MTKLERFQNSLYLFLNDKADVISLSTKFIKRKRKLRGSSFAKAMITANLDSPSSLEAICTLFYQQDIQITKQGVDYRFTKESALFMASLYREAISMMEESLSIDCKLLGLFNSVKLLDSTYINLPKSMSDQYRGYGSSYHNKPCRTQAGLKIQLAYDYLKQVIASLHIQEGIRSDQGYKDYLDYICPQDLLIADLGYFAPLSFKIIAEKKAYFLSRYKTDTNLYDIHTEEKLDLLSLLKGQTFIAKEVMLSSQVKLKVRIICYKLTEEQSSYRRRKANKLARSSGYQTSEKNKNLLDWAIFITNIPSKILADEHISKLYRLRWQIELLFKLYKSYAGIDKIVSSNSHRVMCELYAKLIAMAIFQSLANCLHLGGGKEFSPIKAFKYFKIRALDIFIALSTSLVQLTLLLKNILHTWSRYSLKVNRPRPSTLCVLSNILSISLT